MNPTVGSVPEWGFEGLIPAVNSAAPFPSQRSPYPISLVDLVVKFGITETRRRLLSGLLDYRGELHQAGVVRGFQWIDGSFLENVEKMEGRDPNDIDIVTFFRIPNGHTEQTLLNDFRHLFNKRELKNKYSIDAYYAVLNPDHLEAIVERSVYWYSLWSRTRGGSWKGYLQVELASDEDNAAKSELERGASEGGRS